MKSPSVPTWDFKVLVIPERHEAQWVAMVVESRFFAHTSSCNLVKAPSILQPESRVI